MVIGRKSGGKQLMLSMPHSCRMRPGTLWRYQMEDKPLEASGSSRSSVEVTGRWNGSKLGYSCQGLYAQKHGIDYDETFSPVVKFQSIRVLLASTLQNDLLLYQMDVGTLDVLLLNGTLEENIYMQQPAGYLQQGRSISFVWLETITTMLEQSPHGVLDVCQLCTELS